VVGVLLTQEVAREHKRIEGGDRVVLRGPVLLVFVGSCFALMVVCDEVVVWVSMCLMLLMLVGEGCGIEIGIVGEVCCRIV